MKKLRINKYTEEEVQVWCCLTTKYGELDIEEIDSDFTMFDLAPKKETRADIFKTEVVETGPGKIGVFPTKAIDEDDIDGPGWYAYDICEYGFTDIINPSDFNGWHSDIEDWAAWALAWGVAPDQPFLLSFTTPHYSEHWTDCGMEYDAEYYHSVVDREPLPDVQALLRWEKYFKRYDITFPFLGAPPGNRRVIIVEGNYPPSLTRAVHEILGKGWPIGLVHSLPTDLMVDVAGSIITGSPRRTADMLRSYAEIYGEPVLRVADIYDSVTGEKAQEKRGRAPEFIKDRNKDHWKKKGRR